MNSALRNGVDHVESGYLMAKHVEIRNFRGFRSADAPDCRLINVVVGENGSGKTAFLEALFMVAGNSAELALRTRQWRGFEGVNLSGTRTQIARDMWADLFCEFSESAKASIRLSGTDAHKRSLEISLNPTQPRRAVVPPGALAHDRGTLEMDLGVQFYWRGPSDRNYISRVVLEDGKIKIRSPATVAIESAFFAANQTYSSAETAARFSALSKVFASDEIIEGFREHFPVVKGLSLEMAGGVPMVFAEVEGRDQRVPLNFLSGGMTKLSSILFAIPAFKNGIVMIDEIENGFYYRRFPLIWASILKFCKKYKVQVFASTHSLECLTAAAAVARENPEDFSLIRASQSDGVSVLKQFTGEEFAAAADADIEIR